MRWPWNRKPTPTPLSAAERHRRRVYDAQADACMAAAECPLSAAGNTTDPEIMRVWDAHAREVGLLDPDEPTPYSHHLHQQIARDVAEMEPWERDAYESALAASGEEQGANHG